MSLGEFVLTYALQLVFWLWILRWGGAERLEGTFKAGLLIHILAARWSAEGLKLFALAAIVFSSIAFVLGLVWPDFRSML